MKTILLTSLLALSEPSTSTFTYEVPQTICNPCMKMQMEPVQVKISLCKENNYNLNNFFDLYKEHVVERSSKVKPFYKSNAEEYIYDVSFKHNVANFNSHVYACLENAKPDALNGLNIDIYHNGTVASKNKLTIRGDSVN